MDAENISAPPTAPLHSQPVWRLTWLTPAVCRALLLIVIAFGFFSHLYYLHHNCPIDLSGDEAQYWDWSRQLDLSYYSKGPLVAYIIRASCVIFGDNMPAVRYPALVFGALTSLITYLLARKLFRSDRIALGAVLLYHLVPMFVAGSLLMTIDPPFYFCWGLATYLLAIAIFDEKRWPWPWIGVVVGVGFLAKYAMFLWFVPMLIVLLADDSARHWLKLRWPWMAIGIAALFTTQVIVWNAGHDWVSLKHVSTQTGTNTSGHFSIGNVFEFLGGQVGVLGPGMAVTLLSGTIFGSFHRQNGTGAVRPFTPQVRFLAIIGVTFFAFILLDSFRTKIQMNWPAPAYFTLMILAAYFLSTRLADRRKWKPWRPWFWFSVCFGVIVLPVVHDPSMVYPVINWLSPRVVSLRLEWSEKSGARKWIAKRLPAEGLSARQLDFTAKLKGWEEFGRALSGDLRTLGPSAFVLCHDYQQAAELAFYMDGQPKTFYANSYYHFDPGRMTQYDIWPDRSLTPDSPLVGKNAIFLGHDYRPSADLMRAFDSVVGPIAFNRRRLFGMRFLLPEVQSFIYEERESGTVVRNFRYFICYGFKGMTRPHIELPH